MDHPPISGPRIPTCATLTLITDYDFAESIRVITVGNPSTGGTRALLYARTDDVRTKPRMILWSHKHELVTTALKELLDITQDHLKMHLSSHVYPPSPRASAAAADAARPKVPYPSFSAPSPTPSKASNAATAGGLTTVDDSDVPCWDNDYDNDSATKTKTHQNGDYNYRSSGTGYDPNGAAWSKLRRRS